WPSTLLERSAHHAHATSSQMAWADHATTVVDGGGGPNRLPTYVSSRNATRDHSTMTPARDRACVVRRYRATPAANIAVSTTNVPQKEFQRPSPTCIVPVGVTGISGRCVRTSSGQWLTTSSARVTPAASGARRTAT